MIGWRQAERLADGEALESVLVRRAPGRVPPVFACRVLPRGAPVRAFAGVPQKREPRENRN